VSPAELQGKHHPDDGGNNGKDLGNTDLSGGRHRLLSRALLTTGSQTTTFVDDVKPTVVIISELNMEGEIVFAGAEKWWLVADYPWIRDLL